MPVTIPAVIGHQVRIAAGIVTLAVLVTAGVVGDCDHSPEFVSRAVCLYYRFTLSLRDVEELMFERGVVVSHETIRQWCAMFGRSYANELRLRRPRPGNKWYPR